VRDLKGKGKAKARDSDEEAVKEAEIAEWRRKLLRARAHLKVTQAEVEWAEKELKRCEGRE
jgi:hypothetical protein